MMVIFLCYYWFEGLGWRRCDCMDSDHHDCAYMKYEIDNYRNA